MLSCPGWRLASVKLVGRVWRLSKTSINKFPPFFFFVFEKDKFSPNIVFFGMIFYNIYSIKMISLPVIHPVVTNLNMSIAKEKTKTLHIIN